MFHVVRLISIMESADDYYQNNLVALHAMYGLSRRLTRANVL